MNKRTIIKSAGVLVFLFALLGNLQYAFLGYGLGEGSIGNFVLASTSTGGDSGGDTSCGGESSSFNCVRVAAGETGGGRLVSTECGKVGCPTVNYNQADVTGTCTTCNN